jgi:hypothetical protein
MFRTRSTFLVAAAAIAAATATVIVALGSSASGSAGAPTRAQIKQGPQDAVRFARCVRSHGVPDFPDPTSPRQFKSRIGAGQRSPAFQSAMTACQRLLPSGGPPRQTPAQRQTQLVAALAFARCLHSHGFPNFPDPNRGGQITHEMLANAGIDPRQPAVLHAADACVSATHGLLTKAGVARFAAEQNAPGASGFAGAPTQAQIKQGPPDAVRFARCMRSHGVPYFPDPTSPRQYKIQIGAGQRSPAFQSAMTACQRLLPSGGPPRQTPAQRQTQLVAALAFARCLHSHGFPNLPDPNSGGQITHQMLANAGIDPRQPAVLHAADACVSTTHGLLTKAGVARFAAGQ